MVSGSRCNVAAGRGQALRVGYCPHSLGLDVEGLGLRDTTIWLYRAVNTVDGGNLLKS